jgi:UTP--glucose-1-phosphate uridylyltransferase
MLGDDIIDNPVPCMRQMIGAFEQYGGPVIAVQPVDRAELSAYGVMDGEQVAERVYRVRDLVEKPAADEAPSNLAIIGRYILTPDVFTVLDQTTRDDRGEIQLTNALRALSRERAVFGYRFAGTRHDAGNKLGFLKATVEFALQRPDLGGAFRDYLKSLDL